MGENGEEWKGEIEKCRLALLCGDAISFGALVISCRVVMVDGLPKPVDCGGRAGRRASDTSPTCVRQIVNIFSIRIGRVGPTRYDFTD
jgi:hypothetical protein